jgi:hypothetical protein
MAMNAANEFVPVPRAKTIRAAWPTPNRLLFTEPARFFARTRANADYGRPGWTRDCGKRFHWGCDIAPVIVTPTGQTTVVTFTDCATGREYDSVEPTFVPHDEVFAVWDGTVHEIVNDATTSDFGKHIVIAHRWPVCGEVFYTLYAHLAEVMVTGKDVKAGQVIGRMGQTSRIADARNWMAIAPHLHFEVRDARWRAYDPVAFLTAFLPAQSADTSASNRSRI